MCFLPRLILNRKGGVTKMTDIEILKAALAKGLLVTTKEYINAVHPDRISRLITQLESYEGALIEVIERAFVAFALCECCDKGFETMPCTCMDVSISDEFRMVEKIARTVLARFREGGKG